MRPIITQRPLNLRDQRRIKQAIDADLGLPPEAPLTFASVPPVVLQVRHKPIRRISWIRLPFLRRPAPETRRLPAMTTKRITALVAHGKETMVDRNRTNKMNGI